jgi:two-component system cell cycle response regulator
MLKTQALAEIVSQPSFISNLFDDIRLVDPVRKEIRSNIKTDNKIANFSSVNCYETWGKNATCENCISMRSLNSKRTTIKIELGNSKIFMVTAVPLNNAENTQATIVELIKDITHDGIINVDGLEPTELSKLINRKNESIIKDAITNIYNEQYIFERLPHDLLMDEKQGTNLALFLIRIDNLKAF